MAKDTARAPATIYNYKGVLELNVFPELGDMPAAEITPEQSARVLGVIERRSKAVAHQAKIAMGGTYRWALKQRPVRFNPTVELGYNHASPPRLRVLSEVELTKF